MKLQQLRYLVEIIKQRSFGKAAFSLHIAQPALSYQIRNLEEELGVALLIRHPGGVVPTDAGVVFCEHASAILDRVEQARRAATSTSTSVSGHVAIGITPSACLAFGPEIIEEFASELPSVSINLVEGFSSRLEEWLVGGDVDLAIFYPSSSTSLFDVEPLITQDLVLTGAFADSAMPEQISDFRALAQFPLVSSTRRNKVRKMIDAAAASHGIDLQITMELDALPAIKDLVIRGGRYAVLEPLAIHREVQASLMRTCTLSGMDMSRTLYLGWPTAHPLSRAARESARRIESGIPSLFKSNPAFRVAKRKPRAAPLKA